jgi:hypothetical protein
MTPLKLPSHRQAFSPTAPVEITTRKRSTDLVAPAAMGGFSHDFQRRRASRPQVSHLVPIWLKAENSPVTATGLVQRRSSGQLLVIL